MQNGVAVCYSILLLSESIVSDERIPNPKRSKGNRDKRWRKRLRKIQRQCNALRRIKKWREGVSVIEN